jgi:FkbM family methyltransferase
MRRIHVPLACRLAADRTQWVRILLLWAEFRLRARLRMGRARPRRVRLRLGETEVDWWVADRSDFDVLVSVFIFGEYEGPLPAEASLIVDLGSHVGTTVLYWRQRFPDSEIVAVEPDPEAFERLSRNLGGDPRTTLVNAAIASRSGPIRFASSSHGWSSHLARDEEEAVDVPGLTFPELLDGTTGGRPIDLLKIDIEGAEWNVLDSDLSSVRTIVVETHDSSGEPAGDPALAQVAARERMHQVRTDWDAVSWLVRDGSAG